MGRVAGGKHPPRFRLYRRFVVIMHQNPNHSLGQPYLGSSGPVLQDWHDTAEGLRAGSLHSKRL